MAGTLTASIIRNDTTNPPVFQNSANTEIGTLCRAWVNFNGTTSPGTIRASFNVSSVTKNGTGDYTVNFTNALTDANYSPVMVGKEFDGTTGSTVGLGIARVTVASAMTTTALRVVGQNWASGGSQADVVVGSVAVFR